MENKETPQIEIKKCNNDDKNNNLDETLVETNKRKMVDTIIQKWLILQKTIKEEITLEEVILKHQSNEFEQLKDDFKQYYSKKLESRKILQEIKNIEYNNTEKTKELIIDKELENVNLDITEPVKNLLFTLRNNYDYLITLVSLISEKDEEAKITSLGELFCNQFYENILIPNPEQEELLLLIYKLLELEISPMSTASVDYFLEEDTFLGKFISSFIKRQEIKIFLSSLLNPLILDIENNSIDNYLGMSLFGIKKYIKMKKRYENNNNDNNNDENNEINFDEINNILFKDIPKTTIIIKNKTIKKKENKYINDEDEEEEDEESDEVYDEEIIENLNKNINQSNNVEENNKSLEINDNYSIQLDLDFFENQICKEKDEELKNLYIYELEQITNEEDIFSNKGIIEVLKEYEFKFNRKEIINKYKSNFIFIKSKVDWLIQSLLNKI